MATVTGDPAGMRAAASQLRSRAEALGASASQVDSGVAAMTFAGPAADAFRANVAGGSAKLRSAVARMHALADTLVRQAAIVEEQQRLEAARGGA